MVYIRKVIAMTKYRLSAASTVHYIRREVPRGNE